MTRSLHPSPFDLQPSTWDHAESLSLRHNDVFHAAAFFFGLWTEDLLDRAIAQYAEHKNPKDRSLQRGEAWRAFHHLFGDILRQRGHTCLLAHLYRLAITDDSPASFLRRSLLPLNLERTHTHGLIGPDTLEFFHRGGVRSPNGPFPPPIIRATDYYQALYSPLNHPTVLDFASRATLLRWCAWLDAAIHLRVHYMWHAHPECYSLDPERRELAALGHGQRILPTLDPPSQACWFKDFERAAGKYKNSPKWPLIGQAMCADAPRHWAYPEVEAYVISLWPLVQRFNWTYRDLLNVIRPGLKRPEEYPCECDQEFATYCANSVGMRKTGKGVTAQNGLPKGHEIAQELFPGLNTRQQR